MEEYLENAIPPEYIPKVITTKGAHTGDYYLGEYVQLRR